MRWSRTAATLAAASTLIWALGCFRADDVKTEPDAGTAISAAAGYCAKADECNALVSKSQSECESVVNGCVDALTSSQRKDWNRAANACIDIIACSTFIVCAQQLPYCR